MMSEETRRQAAVRTPICILIQQLAQRSGGAERIVVELANHLGQSGRLVHLLNYERDLGLPFFPLGRGVTHMNLRIPTKMRSYPRRMLDRTRDLVHAKIPYPAALNSLVWTSKRGGFVRAVERYLALHHPQVVIAVAPPAIVTLAHAKKTYAFRSIASLHNVPELDMRSSLRWDRNPLDMQRRERALYSFDQITVLQNEFRDWFEPELRSKVLVVPNPVPPAQPTPFELRKKRILCVGRLAPPKRIHLLIDAWAQLKDEFPDWTVEIFGTGLLERQLKRRIEQLNLRGRVLMRGHTPHIEEEYVSASILAHPAEHEGWGLAVSEALARGIVPIAFSDCPGVNELIINDVNGLLIKAEGERLDHFVLGLKSLLVSRELRERLGARGPASVQQFTPQQVYSRWEAIIDG